MNAQFTMTPTTIYSFNNLTHLRYFIRHSLKAAGSFGGQAI